MIVGVIVAEEIQLNSPVDMAINGDDFTIIKNQIYLINKINASLSDIKLVFVQS